MKSRSLLKNLSLFVLLIGVLVLPVGSLLLFRNINSSDSGGVLSKFDVRKEQKTIKRPASLPSNYILVSYSEK